MTGRQAGAGPDASASSPAGLQRSLESHVLSKLEYLNAIGIALSRERDIDKLLETILVAAKNLTRASLPEIGRCFGGKHHSTVIHSVKKIEAMRRGDADFDRLINRLIESFQ